MSIEYNCLKTNDRIDEKYSKHVWFVIYIFFFITELANYPYDFLIDTACKWSMQIDLIARKRAQI